MHRRRTGISATLFQRSEAVHDAVISHPCLGAGVSVVRVKPVQAGTEAGPAIATPESCHSVRSRYAHRSECGKISCPLPSVSCGSPHGAGAPRVSGGGRRCWPLWSVLSASVHFQCGRPPPRRSAPSSPAQRSVRAGAQKPNSYPGQPPLGATAHGGIVRNRHEVGKRARPTYQPAVTAKKLDGPRAVFRKVRRSACELPNRTPSSPAE
jgi:hypothetical protein